MKSAKWLRKWLYWTALCIPVGLGFACSSDPDAGENPDNGSVLDPAKCGDGTLDPGEACDDGNTDGGDGCSAICTIEADWECSTPGEPCVFTAVCGDGILSATEACDDGNTQDGDGCSADCSRVEEGWECRMPGRPCVPICGDGIVTPPETCDDGNRESGDGCSSNCRVEPGWSCDESGCVRSVCGNGIVEPGESCDSGELNGLYFGDGTGCSTLCTPEPSCRDASGATVACTTACGDGHLDPGEECDDGNQFDGDGCSSDCRVEPGFICEQQIVIQSTPCSIGNGDCLVLPVIYRDFEHQGRPGGHPDFFFMGATGNTTDGYRTTCVTNASGAPDPNWGYGNCSSTDSVDFCKGLLRDTLDADGKPGINPNSNLTCNCRYTDWDNTGVLAGLDAANGVTTCFEGNSSHRRIEKTVRIIKDHTSFRQWFNDSAASRAYVGILELRRLGTSQQFQFNGGGTTVYDDLHAIFLGTQTSLTSGFFPLEHTSGSKLCNLWPYWVSSQDCRAAAGNSITQQWDPRGSYHRPEPGDGGPVSPVQGLERNFYFTSEARYLFHYQGGEVLEFDGDDDFWVFINGRLVLDFGSPHERLKARVDLDGTSAAWTVSTVDLKTGAFIPRGSGTRTNLGLEVGNTYEIAVFHANRHPRESNFRLTLTGFETTRSVCSPVCGDGIVAGDEECDDGPLNQDDLYGGCTTECRFGPYCGDGIVNGDEECDLGPGGNTTSYGMEGCAPGCRLPSFCGDGVVDTAYGEECDDGPTGSAACTSECTVRIP